VSEPVVQVTDLVKRYGEIEAVHSINFAMTAGETFGSPARTAPASPPRSRSCAPLRLAAH
jgi:hypothetical protein